VRFYGDLDGLRAPLAAMHSHFLVYESYETLHTIQNRLNLQLNSWFSFGSLFS
jgi:hypothetical protein